jgi:single-strand DNA-binding protein
MAQPKATAGREPLAASVEEVVNTVEVRGRVSRAPERRELPSGDTIVVAHVVVPRPREKHSRVTHDTFVVCAWRAGPARSLSAVGEAASPRSGPLRRRFWRAGGGEASACEIEVLRLRRLRRSG